MRPRVLTIPGSAFGSNVYVIHDEKIALIDTGLPKDFTRISRAIEKGGLDPASLDFIINTHCHFDHTGGNFMFVRSFGCQVLAHKNDSDVIEKGDDVVSCAKIFGDKLTPVRVGRKLVDGNEICLGNWVLKILHTPGHTAGSICILIPEEGILFSGDTVFANGFGRTDLPTGNPRDLITSLRRLLSESFSQIFPGHGEISEDGKECVKLALKLAREYAETKRGSE